MKTKTPIRHLRSFFKLFVLGSFVATRAASGAATPEDALRHEMAWNSVREGLSGTDDRLLLSADVRRLVERGVGGDFSERVRASYAAIRPEDVAQLDGLWMDRFSQDGAGADTVDVFLEARAAALPQLVQEKADAMDSADKWRSFVREFKRAPYGGL